MSPMTLFGVLSFGLWLMMGCASPPQEEPQVPVGERLLGKSKQDVLTCAGQPFRETSTGNGSLLKYYREAAMLEESFIGSKGSKPGIHRGCWASISIEDNEVVGVEYRTVPPSEYADNYCEQIFESCAK